MPAVKDIKIKHINPGFYTYAICLFVIFMVFSGFNFSRAMLKQKCDELDHALYVEQDYNKAYALCNEILNGTQECPGCYCSHDVGSILEMLLKFPQDDYGPLKLYFRAQLLHGQAKNTAAGPEILNNMADAMTEIETKYPGSGLIPTMHYLLADAYENAAGEFGNEIKDKGADEKALYHYGVIIDKFKTANAEGSLSIMGMKPHSNLAVMSLFMASNIYKAMGRTDDSVKALKKIIEDYPEEKDGIDAAFKADACVQMLFVYTGWSMGRQVKPEDKQTAGNICRTLLEMPDSRYMTFYPRVHQTGSTHAEGYMTLAELEADTGYYNKVITEYPDTEWGEYASEGSTYGAAALARIKDTAGPDARIALYRELIKSTPSKILKAQMQSSIAEIYRVDKKDLKAALAEYRYIADNYKIPYSDQEELGHGEGYADTAEKMIEKIKKEMDEEKKQEPK